MNCSLRAAAADGGAFAFKTTYDEDLRRFAPGLLLEIEFMRRLFERREGSRGWTAAAGRTTRPSPGCGPIGARSAT